MSKMSWAMLVTMILIILVNGLVIVGIVIKSLFLMIK